MTGAFGLAGFYFGTFHLLSCSQRNVSNYFQLSEPGRKPTSASSEASVSMAEGSMPWQVGSSKGDNAGQNFKYQYHPGGDRNKSPKDAPSALNTVIVPNVTLTKVSLKCVCGRLDVWLLGWNADWFIDDLIRPNMIDLISGAKMDTKPQLNQHKYNMKLDRTNMSRAPRTLVSQRYDSKRIYW